ncbi:kinase-like domain-containing protein, partial [Mycena rebaudengoi]
QLSSYFGFDHDPQLREALRQDEELIAKHLVSVIQSPAASAAVMQLQDDDAQNFMDVVQNVGACLRDGLGTEHPAAQRIIRKLSEASERLPSSLFITGVTGREEWPSSGGGFADVYRGYYNGKPVALKLLRQFIRGEELRTIRLRFCREALVWQNLHHPHILPLIGIDRDTFSHSLCMVSPWMAYGTVLQYLNEHGRSNVDKLLFEVVQGLQYIHSCNIVHGDLRGANIFITHDSSACLGDFGLSRFPMVRGTVLDEEAIFVGWLPN